MSKLTGNPIIAFDFDGVIGDLGPGSHMACAAMSKLPAPSAEWTIYDQYVQYGMTLEQYLEALIQYRVLEDAPITPGAAEAMRAARLAGYEIAIVTARGYHPEGEAITLDWCQRHGIEVDHLRLVGPSASKKQALADLGNVVAYVDDLASHLDEVATTCPDTKLYLMDCLWNQGEHRYTRLRSVPEYVSIVLADLGASPRVQAYAAR